MDCFDLSSGLPDDVAYSWQLPRSDDTIFFPVRLPQSIGPKPVSANGILDAGESVLARSRVRFCGFLPPFPADAAAFPPL